MQSLSLIYYASKIGEENKEAEMTEHLVILQPMIFFLKQTCFIILCLFSEDWSAFRLF